ncbi:MAG: POTRA domain-containing protein [Alphaproteobacteria bacterium]|nr:POTRA domain-containing protein [Alphaproteobacteria bacterium]
MSFDRMTMTASQWKSRWTPGVLAISACLGYGVILAGTADAQILNPASLAPESRPAPSGGVKIGVAGGAADLSMPRNADKIFVTVRHVQINGAFPELQQQTAALIDQIQGRRVSLADIYKFAEDLQRAYSKAGYTLARIGVPPQTLQDGHVRITVIDGFIESLDLSGVPERARALVKARLEPLVGKRHLLQSEFERRVLLLGDIAGLLGTTNTRPGSQPGGSILAAPATEKLVSMSVGVDNRLPQALGTWQFSNAATINNAFGLGEQIYLNGASGADISHRVDGWPPLLSYGAGFTLPIGSDGFVFSAGYAWVHTAPTPVPIIYVDQEAGLGTYEKAYARLTYPILMTVKDVIRIQLSFEHVQDKDAPFFTGPITVINTYNLSQDRYNDVRLAGEWTTQFPWALGGRATTALLYTHGLDGRSEAYDALTPLSVPGSSPYFEKLKLDFRIIQPLPEEFQLSLFVKAQTSFGAPLMLPEELSLDGPEALSGFSAGTLNVDTGAVARLELQRSFVANIANSKAVLAPYVFGAWGDGVYEQPVPGQPKNIEAESIGLGLRANANVFGSAFQETLGLELAKNYANIPFSAIPYQERDYRATVSFVMKYAGTP